MKPPKIAPRQVAAGVVLVGLGWLLNSASQPFQRNARTSMCKSNLKRIGLATLQYARDYDEYFPLSRNWADSLKPYSIRNRDTEAGFQQLFRCPTSGAYYALNKFCSSDDGKSYSYWQDTNALPLAFDVSWGTRNFSDDGSLWPLQPVHGQGKYGGNNVLFADGHVKLISVKPEFNPTVTSDSELTPFAETQRELSSK